MTLSGFLNQQLHFDNSAGPCGDYDEVLSSADFELTVTVRGHSPNSAMRMIENTLTPTLDLEEYEIYALPCETSFEDTEVSLDVCVDGRILEVRDDEHAYEQISDTLNRSLHRWSFDGDYELFVTFNALEDLYDPDAGRDEV